MLFKTAFLPLWQDIYRKFTLCVVFGCPPLLYNHNLKVESLLLLRKNTINLSIQSYYTIHTPKMQLNMKNISNIFQILKMHGFACSVLKNGNNPIKNKLCRKGVNKIRSA